MHFCFLVESYYVTPNINGICVENIAKELVKLGHKVTVFTTISEYGLPYQQKSDKVNIYRIHRNISQRLMNLQKKTSNSYFWKSMAMIEMKISSFFHFILMKKWPLLSFSTVFRYLRLAKKVFGNDNVPDVFIGTYFQIEEVLSAIQLKKKYPKSVVFSYLLDAMGGREAPMFFNCFDMHPSVVKWEQYMLKSVDFCIAMEAHRKYFTTHYDKEINKKVIFADIPLLFPHIVAGTQSKTKKKLYTLVYTGFSSPQTGSAEHLFQLMKYMENTELHLYGRMSSEVLQAFYASPLCNKQIFFHGYVSNDIAIAAQKNADALVTFGSVNRCMISGKIFEYMSSKKPIISFYQIKDDINTTYLSKYPASLICDNTSTEVERQAELIQSFLKEDHSHIDEKLLVEEFRNNLPITTAKQIVNATMSLKEGKQS